MNRIRLVLVFMLVEVFTSIIYAQPGPQLVKIVPPSPSAVAFQKYGDIPVSAYTGVPNISIPIYTIKSHDITVPITLSYHAGGIKVSEEASQVGLGWVLNASGQISRNIIGGDDFIGNTYLNGFDNNLSTWSNGQGPTTWIQTGCLVPMYNKNNPNLPTLYTDTLNYYLNATPVFDFQPDQFYYHFADKSGKFILKRNREVVMQKQEKIDIKCLSGDGSSWQITTEDGYKYDFTVYETYLDNENTTSGISQRHKSAWYLTKITSVTGNTVTFQYQTVTNYVRSVGSYSETREDFAINPENFTSSTPVSQKGFTPGKEYATLVLSSIAFDNGSVVFNYSDNRLDLPGDLRLDSIAVLDKTRGNAFKTFVFDYDYFNGTTDPSFNYSGVVSNAVALRLKLKSITEKGNGNGNILSNTNPYRFQYNEANLPAKTSFARDHWGYYNGVTGRASLIPTYLTPNSPDVFTFHLGIPGMEREPNGYWAKAFVLNSITYPTGGFTEFQYEPNEFDEKLSLIKDKSYFNTTKTPVQKTQTLAFNAATQSYLSPGDTLDLTNLYKVNDFSGGSYLPVSLTGVFRFSGNCSNILLNQLDQLYFELYDLNGNRLTHVDPAALGVCSSSGQSSCVICQTNSPVFTYINSYLLTPGKYIWKVYAATTGYPATLQDIRAIFSWYEPAGSGANTITTGGGLRIQQVIDHDKLNEGNNMVRKYHYRYKRYDSSSNSILEYSYGRRMTKPVYSYFNLSVDNYSQALSGGCVSKTYYTLHLMRSSDSENPLNGSASGAVVGYDQVEELFGENGENGKNVYQYINSPDEVMPYNEPFTGANMPIRPPAASTIPNLNNGLLTNRKVYKRDASGGFIKTKETVNTYNDISANANSNLVYGLENRLMDHYNGGDQCSSIIPPQPCWNNILLTYISLKSDRSYLTSTTERVYDQADSTKFSETVANYYYDNPLHLQPTRTVTKNSKGETITTTTRYPLDYPFSGPAGNAWAKGIVNLQNNHVVSTPIERYTQLNNADGSNLRTISAVFTAYDTSLLLPSTIYRLDNRIPVNDFIPAQVTSGSVAADNRYRPYINMNRYDVAGNIIQQQKVNDMYHSYIWDYTNTWPVAEITNASVGNTAYTSFESNGTGNWQGVAAANIQTTITAPTGNKYYTFSGSTLSAGGLDPGTRYMVSYWSNAGSCTVAGASGVTSGRTTGGWTYYEHEITGMSQVTITGNGSIDELRLYPKTAQMTTYTYDPLVGMTSTCDAANKISYYEYDGLGRLHLIRDQDRNIIKQLCYTYNGQPSPCAVAFINTAVSQVFQKNNCAIGGMGSTVTYTVAAGTYSSTISQADANQKALNDVSANGQAYANTNGTCTFLTTYYNTVQSGTYQKNNCTTGGTGSMVTYTVAAGVYSSTISQVDANQKALNDVSTNGQTYANNNGSCTFSNTLQSGTYQKNNCATGGTGSMITYRVAAGVYSSTISQADADQKALNDVSANGQTYANNNGYCTFSNTVQSGTYQKNNCTTGGTGSMVTYTVAAGVYSSTISQADADQKAINDVSSNGQTYANNNGTCTATGMINVTYSNATSSDIYLNLTNTATNVTYNFVLNPGAPNGTIAGQIPNGSYNVNMYSSYGAQLYTFGIYTFSVSGVNAASFYNVPLCATCAVARVSYY